MKMIKGYFKAVGCEFMPIQFEDKLENIQALVGGNIECLSDDGYVIICNEEGIIKSLPCNCEINSVTLFGNVLLLGVDGEEFCDAPEGVLDRLKIKEFWNE